MQLLEPVITLYGLGWVFIAKKSVRIETVDWFDDYVLFNTGTIYTKITQHRRNNSNYLK